MRRLAAAIATTEVEMMNWTEFPRKTRRITRRRAGLLLAFAAAGAISGVGPSPAGAAVFTDLSLPTITGAAVEGETLTEVHARWSAPPAGYAYQWDRCDSSGSHCESISKATTQTYRLTAADVGFTIRVGESARDAEGAVTPSKSEPTAVVKAQASGEKQGGSGGGGGGGSAPPVLCCDASTHTNAAQIKVSLARELVPSGKTASIAELLEHGGLRMSFRLPEAGALVVQWYFLPVAAKAAGKETRKPKLVASGQATFTGAKTITVTIRLTTQGKTLLKRASKLQLEAKGVFTAKGGTAISVVKPFVLKR